jgi:hypothetical protein
MLEQSRVVRKLTKDEITDLISEIKMLKRSKIINKVLNNG